MILLASPRDGKPGELTGCSSVPKALGDNIDLGRLRPARRRFGMLLPNGIAFSSRSEEDAAPSLPEIPFATKQPSRVSTSQGEQIGRLFGYRHDSQNGLWLSGR